MKKYMLAVKALAKIIKNCLQVRGLSKLKNGKKIMSLQILQSYTRQVCGNMWDIPYDNYHAENALYMDDIQEKMNAVLTLKNAIDCEEYLKEFEQAFAEYHNVPYAVGVSSGTAALVLSLIALGIGSGDEVITTPHTYIATALAITDVGARPVFVDIGEDFNIDFQKIEEKISPRTKAILPVHLYGKSCDMEQIVIIAQKHNLVVIEDACQAHGASLDGKKTGTFGNAGCFSFHPTKVIGGVGDGGMVLTADKKCAQKVAVLKEPVHHDSFVLKSRRTPACLDPIHVPFLSVKLRHIREIIERRKSIAAMYNNSFTCIPQLKIPAVEVRYEHGYRNYTLRAEDRGGLMRYLFTQGIQAKVFYEVPLHLRKEFAFLGYRQGDFPACEQAYKEIISLPISHALKNEQVEIIIREVENYYGIKK
ncbi:MAG: DegT/DnrJ/EryC1/StrS family aminotransferase [Candidatus Omnitrophica bacterium]|nr:DegT/DnrJ/EryC1/StrS family aminotransferase [Candidatus Omnitrophota bacterium]